MRYAEFHQRSIEDREGFWKKESELIEWETPPKQILDFSRPPFTRWFVGGRTNLCHNAVDRWARTQPDAKALITVSTELPGENGAPYATKEYSFRELHREVQVMASSLQALGVRKGDRVIVYMPMVAEALFAMLACARIGAIHSVVFGGFASVSLASRIDDATPKLVISVDAGSRNGKPVPYKPLLDAALDHAKHKPEHVLLVDRGLAKMELKEGRDVTYGELSKEHRNAEVAVTWLDSNDTSYILYTSGTSGKPKGVQRDVGGYAVALASSMKGVYQGKAGEVFFSTSDIGWVVGHSYIVYGPLIAGMATIMYEGTPLRPDAGILWELVERYQVSVMFSAPTAIRVLKKQDQKYLKQHDTSSLKALFLAGEPLDEPSARWIAEGIERPIIDNYWQTETGWPILSIGNGYDGVSPPEKARFGSPGFAMPGYDVQLLHEVTGEPVPDGEKGVLAIIPPLPPGCLQTVWQDDDRFVNTYFGSIPERQAYSTFDWGRKDEDGYFYILGRTDDVINVAGHRLGTREIEESISSHASVAECAVVGVADQLKGQVAVACVVLRQAADAGDPEKARALEGALMKVVDQQLGAVARPSRVVFVQALPKTRSGKVVRRSIQAVCEQRDPGDLTTMEDPTALDQLRSALGV